MIARLPAGLQPGPHYMPNATFGVVRATGADDLERVGVRIVIANALHLLLRPGMGTIKALGGLKAMLGWSQALATDSGGFQALSLIRENPKFGHIAKNGLVFVAEGRCERTLLTPQKAIQNQLRLGSDLLFCLDDCTHPDDEYAAQVESVSRTVRWAKACKEAFVLGLEQRRIDPASRPLLFAVIQGGRDPGLRRQCAEALLEIGFDGFGYGGWPIDSSGALVEDMLALTRELVPSQYAMHALGVGHPVSVVRCSEMGYDLFDSALPTRDARRGRLYRFRTGTPDLGQPKSEWFEKIYIRDDKHLKVDRPICDGCDGPCCRRFSTGYIRHLFLLEDALYQRLATLHNLVFMRRLMAMMQSERRRMSVR